jgi:hypothetical protein
MGQSTKTTGGGEDLHRLEAGFGRWRRNRRGLERIPEDLWLEAASVAKGYGVYQVSRRLGLDYNALKRRTEESSPRSPQQDSACQFVEIDMKEAPMMNDCLIELESGGRERMTIRLPRADPADVQAWMTTFWSRRR